MRALNTILSFCIAVYPFTLLIAQDNIILVYDPVTEQVDTIQPVAPTDTVSGFLPQGLGTLAGWQVLDNVAYPQDFQGPAYQRPPHASDTYDLTKYPVRTAGVLKRIEGDSSWTRCSGQLVGPWHVLTASHCLREMFTGEWRTGRIDFEPVFDEGTASIFGSARAVRYYVPLQSERDNALIELEHPLGAELGWLGLGFSTDTAYFDERIVHKFSYPSAASSNNSELIYNGDTLYHFSTPMSRVVMNNVAFGMVPSWVGVPGESGSGVWVTDNIEHHVLGVATWASGYRHTLMDAGTFQQFRTILEDPNLSIPGMAGAVQGVSVYPNPVQSQATFEIFGAHAPTYDLSVRDISGRSVRRQQFQGSSCIFLRNGLASGTYVYQISDATGTVVSGKLFLE